MKRSFALTEAGAVGRRPRRAFEVFWRKTLMEGPSQKVFKNGGWLCLTDAQRYYTTLQFWQVTGSADGAVQNGGEFSATSGQPHGLRARRPRSQGAIPQIWTAPSADGVYPGYLARFSPYLVSYAGCGRDARDPRGICNNLGCTRVHPEFETHWPATDSAGRASAAPVPPRRSPPNASTKLSR